MEYIAAELSNPFGMQPACSAFVPGYGSSTADFHVIGDHPGSHGGLTTGVPFTEQPWSAPFFDTLARGGLLPSGDSESEPLNAPETFFSYLHMCVPDSTTPSDSSYGEMEPFFDAELRAITAHVLLPVGERATRHVLREYTAIDEQNAAEMDDIHATELHGSGWLVIPIKEPATWTDDDKKALVAALQALRSSDYQQISDLGRFQPDGDSYYVR